jgi:diguanylate cyclase (GGDEF)-like protein/PAS domain S-box-containing protein
VNVAPRDREIRKPRLPRTRDTGELREAAARMAEAQEVARFGNWEWVVGEDQVTWSDQLYRILGLDPEEWEPSFETYVERVHIDDRRWVDWRLRRVLEGRKPDLFEHRIVRPDGSVRTLRCHTQPVAGADGETRRLVGVCQDITELADAESARRIAEARFRNAFEHAPIGVALVELGDGEAKVIESNRALGAITGYGGAELRAASLDRITVEEDRALDSEQRRRLLAGEIYSYGVEKRLRHKAGHLIWCQLNVSLSRRGGSEAPDGIVQVQDVSERRRFHQRLQYLADHDSLTGLVNRRRFRSELENQVSFNRRYGGQGAILLIDIDDFKHVNDTLGHHAGDNLIRRVADILRTRVRTTDTVARLSGDEFAVLIPKVDEAGALQLAEDLRSEIAGEAAPEGYGRPLTASIGIATYGGDRDPGGEAALVGADLAMYRAKQEGRDRVSVSEGTTSLARMRRRSGSTSVRIRDALEHDRLTLYSQPIIDLGSGKARRHELLLRMIEGGGALLPAAAFIEAAERSGLAQELDRWVVVRALELVAARQRAGRPVSVHVNLSGASVTDISVLEHIERQLDEGDADPSRLTFEFTETAAIRNLDAATVFADRLTEFGCQVAIDDYGAGFGPFYYLKHLPFDVIKISGDFVRDLPRSDADQLTVQAIVQIARGLGKETIAEYVQDDRTTELLREYGVDMAQGFHLGRPVALPEGLPVNR